MHLKKNLLIGNIIFIEILFSSIQASESVTPKLIPFRMDNQWGYVDKNKKTIVDFKYDETKPFSDGLGLVYLNGKCGYVNEQGKEVIELKYKYCLPFKNGVANILDFHGYINKKGQRINNQEMSNIFGHPVPYIASDRVGLIDKNGKIVCPPLYDWIGYYMMELAPVSKDGKYGLIDLKGKVIFPLEYEDIELLSNGYIKVKKNNMWGIVNKNGRSIIPYAYDYVGDYSEGLFVARKNGKSGFINVKNEIIIPLIYEYAGPFKNGLSSVKINGKCGYIDKFGKTVIPFKYGDTDSFQNGLARVFLGTNNSSDAINDSGYIDTNGIEYFGTTNKAELFGIDLHIATRAATRKILKDEGISIIREDDRYWYDKYDSSSIVVGTSELKIGYTQSDDLAEVQYTFPSHANPKTYNDIYKKIESKYGKSPVYNTYSKCEGDFKLGEAKCVWFVDGIRIELARGWPDTTVKLIYQTLEWEKMNSEIAEAKEQEDLNKQKEIKKYF